LTLGAASSIRWPPLAGVGRLLGRLLGMLEGTLLPAPLGRRSEMGPSLVFVGAAAAEAARAAMAVKKTDFILGIV
jgi:predicted aconitase with swiveling domain